MKWLRAFIVAVLCLVPISAAFASSTPHESPVLSTDKMATSFELFSITNAKVLHSDAEVQEAWWQSIQQVAISSAAYQGPGDINSFSSWGSCSYAYTAAYGLAGSPACDLVDAATGLTTYTMNTLASGAADKVGAASSSACAVACRITKVYDQSGNGHHWVQATLANMPTLTFNAIGTNPAISCVVSLTQSLVSNSITLTVPWSVNAVGYRNGSTQTVTGRMWAFNANSEAFGWTTSANTMIVIGGANTQNVTATDSAGHALQAIFNGASSSLVVDGSSTAANLLTVTATATSNICNGGTPLGSNYYVGEVGTNALSAYSSTLRTNVMARWGF